MMVTASAGDAIFGGSDDDHEMRNKKLAIDLLTNGPLIIFHHDWRTSVCTNYTTHLNTQKFNSSL